MSSLSILLRRAGMLGMTKRALPALSSCHNHLTAKATMYTKPKVPNEEDKIDFRYGFYGDENPEMREFFDSMEEKISEAFHPDMTPQEMKAVLIQAQRTYAVDAPDGVTDGSIADEIHEIHKMLDAAVTRKQEIHGRLESLTAAMKVRAAKAGYAVDSPDGEDDGHVQEEQHEVDRLINESSPASASKKQPVSGKDDMIKKRASDPEHW